MHISLAGRWCELYTWCVQCTLSSWYQYTSTAAVLSTAVVHRLPCTTPGDKVTHTLGRMLMLLLSNLTFSAWGRVLYNADQRVYLWTDIDEIFPKAAVIFVFVWCVPPGFSRKSALKSIAQGGVSPRDGCCCRTHVTVPSYHTAVQDTE